MLVIRLILSAISETGQETKPKLNLAMLVGNYSNPFPDITM